MATRPCRTWNWLRALKSAFCRSKPLTRRVLQLVPLEDRTCPAVFFPSPLTPDGAPGSLRADIIQANTNTDPINVFRLQAGTYNLTLLNVAGQENAAATGDLDLTTFGKTYTFRGQSRTGTIINANQIDRVFQVFPNVTAQFITLTIEGGLARDDGTTVPGPTDALGGGVLNNGGTLLFNNAVISNNAAEGKTGSNGSAGVNGTSGFAAKGGGIYSMNGNVTLRNYSRLEDNTAQGGQGGDGGNTAQVGPTLFVGNGGMGGLAQGGGLYLSGGHLLVGSLAFVSGNFAGGGDGGAGGDGENEHTGGTGGAGGLAQGGAFYAQNSGLSITDAYGAIDNNTATGGDGGSGGNHGSPLGGTGGQGGNGQGGGLFAQNGPLAITQGRFTSNYAQGGDGGTGGNGSSSNSGGEGGTGGTGQGGGLFLDTTTTTIALSVISNNQAIGGDGGLGGNGGPTGTQNLAGGDGGLGGLAEGGGLFVNTPTTTFRIKTSTVAGNIAQGGDGGDGGHGGTSSAGNSSVTLTGGAGNTGGLAQGGGLYLETGTVVINACTFSTDQALGGDGGNGGNGGTGSNSTGTLFLAGGNGGDGNAGQGGALYTEHNTTITLINSTISSNLAKGGFGGDGGDGGSGTDNNGTTTGTGGTGGNGANGQGGGVFNGASAHANFYNSTIALNQALGGDVGFGGNPGGSDGSTSGLGQGGGVYSNGALELAFSTIFADNSADTAGPDFFGNITATACLFGNTSGVVISGGPNLLNRDPQLLPLADNGGPTFTQALKSNSPALNRGINPFQLAFDQRGFPRLTNGFIDIGAYQHM